MRKLPLALLCYFLMAANGFTSLLFQGFTNTSLGGASISISCCISNLGSSGQDGLELVVTNLGSSGQDGVSISMPANLTALEANFLPLDVSNTLPVGAYVQEQWVGTDTGTGAGELGSVTATKECAVCNGTNWIVQADFSAIGASNYTVQAYYHEVLVGQTINQNGTSLAYCGIIPFKWDIEKCDECPQRGMLTLGWGAGTTVILTGGAVVTCDHLYITPQNVTLSAPTAFQFVASQVPGFTITTENASLVFQGLTNTSLGAASVDPVCCVSNLGSGGQDGLALVITNLGSSGQDGLSVALPANLTALQVSYEPLDPSNTLPVGAYVQEQVVGTVTALGITDDVLGTVTTTKECAVCNGTNWIVDADYSAIGASTYTVQAYLNGILVAQATGQPGPALAAESIPPNGDDIGDIVTPVSQELGGGHGLVTFAGSTNIPCDRVVITPENVPFEITPTAFQIVASQVPGITITSENESLVYQGLTNTSLGSASVAIACCVSNLGSGGQDGLELYVTNLGSSGQDGVSVAMPPGMVGMQFSCPPSSGTNPPPVGSYFRSQVIGTAAGITNGLVGTVTVTAAATNNYVVSADFSAIGAQTYTVQAWLAGAMVDQETGQDGSNLAEAALPPDSLDLLVPDASVHWPTNLLLTFGGGFGVVCDHIEIIPEFAESYTPSAFQVVASGVPWFTLASEEASLVFQGLTNTSLGSASVSIDCCVSNLGSGGQDGVGFEVISNLGSSGQDGISIALSSATNFAVGWLPLDPGNILPVGAYVESQLVGSAGGITNGVLGTETCTKEGTTNFVISVDYSPIGSSTRTVQVYDGTNLVAQVTGQGGSEVATTKLPPGTCTINPYLNQEWPVPTYITISSGPTVLGTEILMIPEGGATISSVSANNILASGIPSITVLNEGEIQSYSINLQAGNNFIANQLDHGSNTLNEIMPVVPDGSIIYKYDNASGTWSDAAYHAAQGTWSPSTITLSPGEGAYFQSPTNYWLTFTGVPHVPVLPVSIPSGACYLLSRQTNDVGNYGNIIGNPPAKGSRLYRWNPATQSYLVYSYPGSLSSTNPALNIGESVWITTSGQPPPPVSLVFQGVTNTGTGNATIFLAATNGPLIISNLGSSGQDGVTISLPTNLTALETHWQALDPSGTLPVGAYIREQFVGAGTGGTGGGAIGSVTVTKECAVCNGTNYLVSANFSSIGASNYTVQAWLNGIMVGQATGLNGSALAAMSMMPFSGDSEGGILVCTGSLDFGTNTAAVFLGASTSAVLCDHLYITPENVTLGSPVTAMQILASQVPVITITSQNESLVFQGLTNTSLGTASVDPVCCVSNLGSGGQDGLALVITNLGSSGQDGVSIALPGDFGTNLTKLVVAYEPFDPSNTLPVGSYIQSHLVGTAAGVTNGVLGSLTVTKESSNEYSLTMDFSPVEPTNVVVQAYLQGVLVAQETNAGSGDGIIIILPGWPISFDIEMPLEVRGPQLTMELSGAVALELGGQIVTCDQLAVMAGKTFRPGRPTFFELTASGVPGFTLTSTTVSPLFVYLTRNQQNLTLQWYGPGVLQSSSDLKSWSSVTGAISPYTVPIGPTKQYFRIVREVDVASP